MESNETTWRPHPLEVGQTYFAAESFRGSPNAEFVCGSRYVLKAVNYSRYDSMTIFSFQPADGGPHFQWWWHDTEPDTQCKERWRVAA